MPPAALAELEDAVALDQQRPVSEIFERHEEISARFDALVEAHVQAEDPIALERPFARRQKIILTESARSPGDWQITYFDEKGAPVADSIYTSKRRAVEDFFRTAKLVPSPQAADALGRSLCAGRQEAPDIRTAHVTPARHPSIDL